MKYNPFAPLRLCVRYQLKTLTATRRNGIRSLISKAELTVDELIKLLQPTLNNRFLQAIAWQRFVGV